MKILAIILLLSVFVSINAQTPTGPLPSASPKKDQSRPESQTSDLQDDVVKVTTNLVQVDAVVTKDGKPVTNLTAEDFEILEDGKPQPITNFTYVTNVPLKGSESGNRSTQPLIGNPPKAGENRRMIAMVVDDLGLSVSSINEVRRQLRKFVAEQMGPNDLVAILRTGSAMGILQQFTQDRRLIEQAISQLDWNLCSRVGIGFLPAVGGSAAQPICAMDSERNTIRSLRFIVEALGHLPGRKAMVLFSDSMPLEDQDIGLKRASGSVVADSINEDGVSDSGPGSHLDQDYEAALRKIAEKAIRSSVVIYAVDTGGLVYTGITASDSVVSSQRVASPLNSILQSRSHIINTRREGSQLIAKQTGGFLVRNSNDFQLDRILEDQIGYYLIGYRPPDNTFNRDFHKIQAHVKKPGMTVRTRFGFFGVSQEEVNRLKPTAANNATLALASPFVAQGIRLDLTAFFVQNQRTGPVVHSYLRVNANDLTFTTADDGSRRTKIELLSALFGDNGVPLSQQTLVQTLILRSETYDQALREGITLQFDTPVKRAGSYQFRVATRDEISSRTGSAGQFVTIPDLNQQQPILSGLLLRSVSSGRDQQGQAQNEQPNSTPAVRQFLPSSTIEFVGTIYNLALRDKQVPNLVMESRLIRRDKVIYAGPETPVNTAGQSDPQRFVVRGVIPLDKNLEPGTYFLQVSIKDPTAKAKAPVTQWIDFDVLKP